MSIKLNELNIFIKEKKRKDSMKNGYKYISTSFDFIQDAFQLSPREQSFISYICINKMYYLMNSNTTYSSTADKNP